MILADSTGTTKPLIHQYIFEGVTGEFDATKSILPNCISAESTGEFYTLQATFEELADEWERETLAYSFMSQKMAHPAYQKLVRLGVPAIPLIRQRMKQDPGYWYAVIRNIEQSA